MSNIITKKEAEILVSISFVAWLFFAFFKLPVSPFQIGYVQILILVVPTFLLTFAAFLLCFSRKEVTIGLVSGLTLMMAFVLEKSEIAAILTLPWLLWTVWMALVRFQKWLKNKSFDIAHLNLLAASLFLPVGAAWAFADRLDFRPFDFDATITLLTAAHFNYAGFILALLTGLILSEFQNKWARLFGIGVIIGVPLVAIGITTSHFLLPEIIETACVTILASSAFGIGFLHLIFAFKIKENMRWLSALSGLALMAGMTLAMGYGWRYYVPISFLSIPWMYAVHGTLNAVGFALPGVLGWFMGVKQR
ncbi:MAG: hypothetical protein ACI9XO_000866 [Paraglaciecola sp.]|jgi:hypothetical protein